MAASTCPITGGYNFGCRTNQGGIKTVYVGMWNDTLTTFTYGTLSQANEIIAVGGATVSFYTVNQRQEQGMADYQPVFAPNGGVSYDHVVSLVIERPDNLVTNWMNILDQGLWRIIVLDSLSQYWMYGLQNGAYTTGGQGGPGGKIADTNKAVVAFKALEPSRPVLLSNNAALSLITGP